MSGRLGFEPWPGRRICPALTDDSELKLADADVDGDASSSVDSLSLPVELSGSVSLVNELSRSEELAGESGSESSDQSLWFPDFWTMPTFIST